MVDPHEDPGCLIVAVGHEVTRVVVVSANFETKTLSMQVYGCICGGVEG